MSSRLGLLLAAFLVLVGPATALAAPVGPQASQRQMAAELNQASKERTALSKQLSGIGATLSSMKTRVDGLQRKTNRIQLRSGLATEVLRTEVATLSRLLQLMLSLSSIVVLTVLFCLARMIQRFARVEAALKKPSVSAAPSMEDLLQSPLDHPQMQGSRRESRAQAG